MKLLFLLLFSLLISSALAGQTVDRQVIAAAGQEGAGAGAQISWTAGEVVTSTLTTGTNVLSQGFHQTNLVVTALDEPAPLNDPTEITVFPNPVRDQLNVRIENASGPLKVTVFDVQGKLLIDESAALTNGTYTYDFSAFAVGTYYLRAHNASGKQTQSFKIAKTQ